MGAGLLDELAQVFNGEHCAGAAMHHAVAVGAEWAEVGHGVNHAFAAGGKRVEVMHFYVGTGVGRAVKRIKVEAARHARHAVCALTTDLPSVSIRACNNGES